MAAGNNKYGVPSYSKEYRQKYNEENRERRNEYAKLYARKKRLEAANARGEVLVQGRPRGASVRLREEIEAAKQLNDSFALPRVDGRIEDGSPIGASPLVDETAATAYVDTKSDELAEIIKRLADKKGKTPEEAEAELEASMDFRVKKEEQ
jgi:hypothetical protein